MQQGVNPSGAKPYTAPASREYIAEREKKRGTDNGAKPQAILLSENAQNAIADYMGIKLQPKKTNSTNQSTQQENSDTADLSTQKRDGMNRVQMPNLAT